jgi:hypothetical protein
LGTTPFRERVLIGGNHDHAIEALGKACIMHCSSFTHPIAAFISLLLCETLQLYRREPNKFCRSATTLKTS